MQKITISASSLTGLVREHNEDALLVCRQVVRDSELNTSAFLSPEDRYVVAVCDGLGGQNAGEVASMDAAMQLAHRVATLRPGQPFARVQQLLHEWIKEEHAYLMALGEEDPSMSGMGTTLVGLLFYEGHVCWMNCGDSRLYRFREGILRQLSSDHSLYSITHREEDLHVITNCLGGGADEAFLDVTDITGEVHEGDLFLLCSDGLTDMLTDEEIEQVLAATPEANALTQAAVEHGGRDNVSVCLLRIDSEK